jgi:hypothetical protein
MVHPASDDDEQERSSASSGAIAVLFLATNSSF